MRARILLLAFLAIATRATGAVHHYEMFLVDPKNAVRITLTDKGNVENIDVVLSKQQAASYLAFKQRNRDKEVIIGYIQRQKGMSMPVIEQVWLNRNTPITGDVLHIQTTNPHRNPQIIDPIVLPSSDAV